ncbi:transglycosylase SLT domain protein, partial [Escherichia coli 90.0039]
SLKPLFFI